VHPTTEAIAARVAWENAHHDAYAEHVVQKAEFSDELLGAPVEINSRSDFKEHVADVLENQETQCFTAFSTEHTWRQADIYYHEPTNTAVVVPADERQAATAFRPEDGQEWFTDRLDEARAIEPSIEVKQGGISALYPAANKNPEGEKPVLNDLMFIVEETVKAGGEVATGVTQEVAGLVNDYSAASQNSEAPVSQQAEAAYAALSVENSEKYPPLSDNMKIFVEDRQLSESMDRHLQEASGGSLELSPEEQQAQMQDRMQSYIDQQKQYSMSM
jgi:hypothetical protein